MKRFWLAAGATLMFATMLPDGVFAQPDRFRGPRVRVVPDWGWPFVVGLTTSPRVVYRSRWDPCIVWNGYEWIKICPRYP